MDNAQASAFAPQMAMQGAQEMLKMRHRQATIIRMTFLLAIVALGALGFAAFGGRSALGSPETIAIEATTFGFVSLVSALCAIFLVPAIVPLHVSPAARTSAQSAGGSVDQIVTGRLFSRAILTSAMTEVPGLLGFILLVMGADATIYLAFLAIALLGSAVTWPRRSAWETAVIEETAYGSQMVEA